MIVGVIKETKSDENRVALTPVGAEQLTRRGHDVLVESQAGAGCGLSDERYHAAGAKLLSSPKEVLDACELLVKVKEPQPKELSWLQPKHTVFGYFHFAGSRQLTEGSLESGYTAVAFETLRAADGSLPLLIPMSEVAGRLSIQSGAKHLEQHAGGRGILLGGVPGVAPARVVVLGGGIVGHNAARMAAGLGARVTILDVNLKLLRSLDSTMPANVSTLYSDHEAVRDSLRDADLVIGAVLLPGKKAPKLITRALLMEMQPGSVVVDVCIDQGGCMETSRPTTHSNPTYVEEGVVHYCVANMPAAVSRTSTHALCNATLPYLLQLADLGVDAFLGQSPGHRESLNLRAGAIVSQDVAEAFEDLPHASLKIA